MDIPKLSQCFLCKGWRIESTLFKIMVPDQTGWIEKKACHDCLGRVMASNPEGESSSVGY